MLGSAHTFPAIQVFATNPKPGNYIKVNYANPTNVGEFVRLQNEIWKPFILEMAPKWTSKSKKQRVFLKPAQKRKTAFRLRRRERIEARTFHKSLRTHKKNNLRTNIPTIPILLQKVAHDIATKSMKISPPDHLPDPVSPDPSI